MYDTMFVAVFDDESAAYKGASALKELHAAGDVAVYASAVIAKDAEGAIAIKQAQDEGPIGMADMDRICCSAVPPAGVAEDPLGPKGVCESGCPSHRKLPARQCRRSSAF